MINEERRKAAEWFRNRAKNCPMSGARRMYEIATEALEMAVRALEGDGDTISRQQAIDEVINIWADKPFGNPTLVEIKGCIEALPSAQPEIYKEKLKEIADALSEKFAYMNTCLNERDIILGYLGVKRPSKIHCDTDCTNIKCESYRCNKRLPSAQPKKQASDEIYSMMKDYYFEHRNNHDESWQGGFAECMNLIPNAYERREDGRSDQQTGGD